MRVSRLVACASLLTVLWPVFPASARKNQRKPSQDPPAANATNDGDSAACRMIFDLESWSFTDRTTLGRGTITCSNGQTATVSLTASGVGLAGLTQDVDKGTGDFGRVADISQLYTAFSTAELSGGAGRNRDGQILSNGDVSLTLHGTGTGQNLELAFSKLEVKPIPQVPQFQLPE